jgi:hypothetical protein
MNMLRPLQGEIILFARVLSALPETDRAQAAIRILAEIEFARSHLNESGRSHPDLGDGSLFSRLLRADIPPSTAADTPEFLHALRIVADALLKHTAS